MRLALCFVLAVGFLVVGINGQIFTVATSSNIGVPTNLTNEFRSRVVLDFLLANFGIFVNGAAVLSFDVNSNFVNGSGSGGTSTIWAGSLPSFPSMTTTSI